jgi:hypothetical protein
MFEKATRMKLRFPSNQGSLSAEDLWELPLESKSANRATLNTIAVTVDRDLKESGEVNFVRPNAKPNAIRVLQLEILKHIIKVRQDEAAAVKDKAAIKENNQKIMAIIERKGDKALEDADLATLQAMIKPEAE